MTEMMGLEGEAQRARKGYHLRRNHGFWSRAGDHNHAGIIDDTTRAAPFIEAYRLEQELFRLEACKPRVVLEEQPARVGERESGTLGCHRPLREHHPVGRSIMLQDRKSTRLNSSHLGISY